MRGCRPLTGSEITLIVQSFGGTDAARDKALFLLGVKSGFRISELLSLRISDVWEHGKLVSRVTVARRYMEHKPEGRTISRVQAWRILQEAYATNGLTGKLGAHSLGKTFADRIYERLHHDLVSTQKALGHRHINSTMAYLAFKEADIDRAILAM
jgi:integrase